MSQRLVGIDIGGTKIAAGVVDADGTVLAREQLPTPAGGENIAAAVAWLLGRLGADGGGGATVGVAVPGYVSTDHRSVANAANLELKDARLADWIEERADVRAVVLNDANAALWAEFRFGAARGVRDVAMLTVGTGIGGGLLVNGQLVSGAHGWAGEAGHMTVVPDGRPCGCGSRGCLDRYASGTALGHPAASAEDFAELGHWLGYGLSQVAMLLDPELFLLGGGVSAAGAALTDPTERRLAELLAGRGREQTPPVRLAQLGPDAGFIGAAAYAADLLAGGVPAAELPVPAAGRAGA
ncbi:ROK family protein [Pseudarthrobacter sp. P1]|uniref:ROK family protein n=1 Tax=Pseudarthrobacter sp. P1 TaxID=3418418 RepID=UPI003CF9A11D